MTNTHIKQAVGVAAWLAVSLTGAFKGFLFFADLINTVFASLLAVVLMAALLPLLSAGRSLGARLARTGAHILNVFLFTVMFAAGISGKFDQAQLVEAVAANTAANVELADARLATTPGDARLDKLDAQIRAQLELTAKNSNGKSTGISVAEITRNCTATGFYFNAYCREVLTLQAERKALESQVTASDRVANLSEKADLTATAVDQTADRLQIGRNVGFILKLGGNNPDMMWYVIAIAAFFALLVDVTAGHACRWVHPEKAGKTADSSGQVSDSFSDSSGQVSGQPDTHPPAVTDVASKPVQGVLQLVERAAVASGEKLAELKFKQEQETQKKQVENKPVFFDSTKFMRRITPEQVRQLLAGVELPADPTKAAELVGALVYVCRAAYAPRNALKIADVLQQVADHNPAAASLVTKYALTRKVIPLLVEPLHFVRAGKDAQGRNVWDWAGKAEIEMAVRRLAIEEQAA